jgi:hypothetical protein
LLKSKIIKSVSDHRLNLRMLVEISKKTGKPVLTAEQATMRALELIKNREATWNLVREKSQDAVGLGDSIVKVYELTFKI